jgi:hypothetical protein
LGLRIGTHILNARRDFWAKFGLILLVGWSATKISLFLVTWRLLATENVDFSAAEGPMSLRIGTPILNDGRDVWAKFESILLVD